MPDNSQSSFSFRLPKIKKRGGILIILVATGIILSFIIWLYFSEFSLLPSGFFYHTSPFKVTAAGDWGCGDHTDRTVANIKAKDPRVILALGDLGYQGSGFPGHACSDTGQWARTMEPIRKNLFFVVGNHDIAEKSIPNLLQIYLEYFGMCSDLAGCREPYYSFNLERVHFLILNSEYGWKKGTPQYLFAVKDLSIASSDPDTNWIVVAYHSARYATIDLLLERIFSGSLMDAYPKPYEGTDYIKLSKEFVDTYHPLFDKYRVDLVLQGHVHNYQRSYPLKYETDMEPPTRTSTIKDVYNKPIGQIYLTVGTGGAEQGALHESVLWISALWHKDKPTDDYYIVKADNSHHGFLELQFSKERKALLGTFYGNDVLKGSVVLDQFSILK